MMRHVILRHQITQIAEIGSIELNSKVPLTDSIIVTLTHNALSVLDDTGGCKAVETDLDPCGCVLDNLRMVMLGSDQHDQAHDAGCGQDTERP